jgi:hypothetical protein
VRFAAVLLIAAGCGFQTAAGTAIDDARDDAPRDGTVIDGDGSPLPMIDAPIDSMSGECGGKRWVADFSSDPTVLDVNGDQIPDWIYRGGGTFPTSQLSGGIWHIPSATLPPLDMRPAQDFTTRTIVRLRLKGALPNSGSKGAVFYMNVGFTAPVAGMTTYATLLVDAKRENNATQTLSLWVMDTTGAETRPAMTSGLPDQFQDVKLDIDPVLLNVTVTTPGQIGTYSLFRQPPTSISPRFFSALGYSTAGDFDFVSVEVCP